MRTLVKFGSGSRLYTFPTRSQVSFTDNFASLVTKTVRMPGVNGGFSNLGLGRGLSPIGTVRADNWLTFNDFVEASDKVDSLRQMADWGLQPLFMQPLYGPVRWCWARLNDQQLQQDVHNVPHRQQKVPIVFEVPDPFWYSIGTEIVWGGGALWGAATSIWGGSGGSTSVTASGTISVTVGGNAFTFARIFVKNTSGAAASNLVIKRTVGSEVEDQVSYSGTIPTGTTLVIHPRRRRVLLGTENMISEFDALNPDWMRLYPGANTLKVSVGGTVVVGIRYFERYV
jgi:hypothetical protein